jgi:hypothetical protein
MDFVVIGIVAFVAWGFAVDWLGTNRWRPGSRKIADAMSGGQTAVSVE